jgi:superfamily I DNA and RNA helicase
LHINGLLEKKIENPNFYKIITPFVYFHNQTKKSISRLFDEQLHKIEETRKEVIYKFKNQSIAYESYQKTDEHLDRKKRQFTRDRDTLSITYENLNKITNLDYFRSGNTIFNTSIYDEFKRLLQPPYHELTEGIEIVYEKKQQQFSESKDEHTKIKGVAGSGKTVVLAKRAVNAHKRHGDMVLILTYNLTLKSYIHDCISDVREGFSWGYFYINNYHQLILQTLNQHNIKINPSGEKLSENQIDQVFSNINIFESTIEEMEKYKTILIDETQDYKPEWIKIVRKYFLAEDGEMVLFGDEKQNIYERALDSDNNSQVVQGFGSWKQLNKSIRHKQDSHILVLAKEFQKTFLSKKYDIDKYKENVIQQQMPGLGINKVAIYSDNCIEDMVKTIFRNIKEQNLHPDDVAIICSHINTIKEVDYIIRNKTNERTITTFEPKEFSETVYVDLKNMRRSKKVGFNHHSGVVKLATTHSFKGFESSTVFLILNNNDQVEMVYTGITRAKFNIMVFLQEGSRYKSFFQSYLQFEQLIKDNNLRA